MSKLLTLIRIVSFTHCVLCQGGQPAIPHAWPWHAALAKRSKLIDCQAVLVHPHAVLTAAHCVPDADRNNMAQYCVFLGVHDLLKTKGIDCHVPNSVTIHPQFDEVSADYDLAVLHFEVPIELTEEIRPICMPEQKIAGGSVAYYTSWGPDEEGFPSTTLRVVPTKIMPNTICRTTFGRHGFYNDTMICGCRNSCHGDSGGPLMHLDNKTGAWQLDGIISWGYSSCDANIGTWDWTVGDHKGSGTGGVYTNVRQMTEFIQKFFMPNINVNEIKLQFAPPLTTPTPQNETMLS